MSEYHEEPGMMRHYRIGCCTDAKELRAKLAAIAAAQAAMMQVCEAALYLSEVFDRVAPEEFIFNPAAARARMDLYGAREEYRRAQAARKEAESKP